MGLTPGSSAERPAQGPERPLIVWCLLRDQRAHVEPVERYFGGSAEFVYDSAWEPEALVRRRPDLVLCVNDWPYEIARCLDAARASGIPSLVLQDGILEWRCQYENPLFGAGGGAPQHQPVLADRIACIGPQSARQIEAWGNRGRTVVTGMPRLDDLLARSVSPTRNPGHRLLVMTAKNPGFTPEQRETTLESLRDVRDHLAERPEIEVVWRLPAPLGDVLGVTSRQRQTESAELAAQIEEVDAVITTPSTAMLEAMLLRRPVAALDYHNVPRFVPTSWTIAAKEHVAKVVDEVLHPTASRMLFQENTLEDCLECEGAAAPRVGQVMRDMAAGRRAGASPDGGQRLRGAGELAALYPGQSAFSETDVRRLQVRVARAEKTVERLLREKRHRSLSQGVYRFGKELVRFLRGPQRSGH